MPDSLFLQAEPCIFIKKETLAQWFPVNFVKFLRTPSRQNTSGGLLLKNSVNQSIQRGTANQ